MWCDLLSDSDGVVLVVLGSVDRGQHMGLADMKLVSRSWYAAVGISQFEQLMGGQEIEYR
jgi:hypothetical protein